MIVKFLGYANSIQHKDSSNVSLLVSSANFNLLIDVSGSPIMEMKRANIDPISLSMVLLTHSHVDHIYALPSLIHQLWLMGKKDPLIILSNKETIKVAKQLCEAFSLRKKKGMFTIIWETIEQGVYLTPIDNIKVEVFAVAHGVDTIGCAIVEYDKKFVYLADGAPLSQYPKCTYDADILVHEAGGLSDQEDILNSRGHSSAYQAGQTANLLHANLLLICHIEEDITKQKKMLKEAKQVFLNTKLPVLYKAYNI